MYRPDHDAFLARGFLYDYSGDVWAAGYLHNPHCCTEHFDQHAAHFSAEQVVEIQAALEGHAHDLLREKRVIACNTEETTSKAPRGSKAYVNQIGYNRAFVLVRSRDGRWIGIWMPIKRLCNLQMQKMPPQSPIFDRLWVVPDWMVEGIDDLGAAGAGQGLKLR